MTNEVNLSDALKTSVVPKVNPTPSPVAINWINLENYIITNKEKIQNADLINLDKMTGIPKGKYFLFKTRCATDAELVLFKQPATLWVVNQPASEIKVKDSGLVIKTTNYRIYAGKNNVVKIEVNNDGKVSKVSTISRTKNIKNVKEETENVENSPVDVDTSKLYIKKASPRLYSKIKDMTKAEDIKKVITAYMDQIEDINHLIKLENDLLYSCQL